MINFLKYKWLYFLISTVVLGAGFFSIATYGFDYSIDFIGGSLVEYRFDKKVSRKLIEKVFQQEKTKIFAWQGSSEKNYVLRTASLDDKKERDIRKKIETISKTKANLLRFETVGPKLGKETTIKTITASIVAVFGILVYITFAFRNFKYGLAAVLAMIHDFFIMIGSYSLMSRFLGAEVDTLFVTALLTTMSFSVHDTIVVFDKIREYQKTAATTEFSILANKALTETMVRSLNNSLTIVFVLLALLFLGGKTVRFFIAALLIGTISGTYSSPFVATPILEILETRKK